ncbi:MAG: hypothetical protein LBT59_30700 [Clostridiales bacterium]|nr:hypothetical protein [Clostridiales bacterium]
MAKSQSGKDVRRRQFARNFALKITAFFGKIHILYIRFDPSTVAKSKIQI